MLAPLPPGKHRVSMSSTLPNLDPVTGDFLGDYIHLDANVRLQNSARPHDR